MNAERIEEIRMRVSQARRLKDAAHPKWYERNTYRQVTEDAAELLAEVERLRTAVRNAHDAIGDLSGTPLRNLERYVIKLDDLIDIRKGLREAINDDEETSAG